MTRNEILALLNTSIIETSDCKAKEILKNIFNSVSSDDTDIYKAVRSLRDTLDHLDCKSPIEERINKSNMFF